MRHFIIIVLACLCTIQASDPSATTPLLRELMALDCTGKLHILSSSITATTVDLGLYVRAINSLVSQLHLRTDCKCGAGVLPEAEFRQRFSPIEAMLFASTYPSKDNAPPERPCLDGKDSATRDFYKAFRTFLPGAVQVPDTCTPASYYNGMGCFMTMNVMEGLSIDMAATQCPNSYMPYVSVTCKGPYCSTLQPCELNEDCPDTMECKNTLEYLGYSQEDGVKFFAEAFVYNMNTIYNKMQCDTPDALLAKIFGALKDLFPTFPKNYEETKMCFPKLPYMALNFTGQFTWKNSTQPPYPPMELATFDPKAPLPVMAPWDGAFQDGTSVLDTRRLNGVAFPAMILDPPYPSEVRLGKLGCDSLFTTTGFSAQVRHVGRVLSAYGDTVLGIWTCRASPTAHDSEHIEADWSDDFQWLMNYMMPQMKLQMSPWEATMYVWGMTTNGVMPSAAPTRTPSWNRGNFDPTMFWIPPFGNSSEEPPKDIPVSGAPDVMEWSLHAQTPPPLYEGRPIALKVPCTSVSGVYENVSIASYGSGCTEKEMLCSVPVQKFSTMCIVRMISCDAPAGSYQVCLGTAAIGGRLEIHARNNSHLFNLIGDRLQVASTCNADDYRANGLCGFSLNELMPHTTFNVRISSCEGLTFGHSSIELSCTGQGCGELDMKHVCALDSDCTEGFSCTDYGDIVMDQALGLMKGMVTLPIPPETIKGIIRNHDLLAAVLFGGVSDPYNMKLYDLQGLMGELMSPKGQCKGTGYHTADVIAMYNAMVGANVPLTSPSVPKVCYNSSLKELPTKLNQMRLSQLAKMTELEALCTNASLCPLQWVIPGMRSHNPWRTHPALRLTFPSKVTDPQGLMDMLADYLQISRTNIEIRSDSGNTIDFSFSALSDSSDISKKLLGRNAAWWRAALHTDATLSCLASCPTTGGHKKHTHQHSGSPGVTAAIVIMSLIAVALVGVLIRQRYGDRLVSAGWMRLPTTWAGQLSSAEVTEMNADLDDDDAFENAAAELGEQA